MGDLTGLENLDLDGCKRLEALPKRLDDMKGLKNIILGSCSTLTGLSERLRALGMRSNILQEPCKRFEPAAPRINATNFLGLRTGEVRMVPTIHVPQDVRCFRRFEKVAKRLLDLVGLKELDLGGCSG